ncbi:MAG: hypothetical protein KJ958_05505 [Gammaproteobacteria bacterium]|nr:hypothetical protein [Gammaproteobacteria bacterium]MBU1978610.1 hypothetical protein [Gammaproteobacteria bacterium]
MSMTPNEVEEIVKKTIDAMDGHSKSFWVDPEKHYKSHDRLDKLLDVFDGAQSVAMKTLVGAMVLGGLILAAISMGFKK